MKLFHHTDTARLPWILHSGELRPGSNRVGGFPFDFLWATTDERGDPTASAHQGDAYRRDKVRHARFVLDSAEFVRWKDVPALYPAWTPHHVERIEAFKPRGKSNPSTWWCRAAPLKLSADARIETRSYMNPKWAPLGDPDIQALPAEDGMWIGVMIGRKGFLSRHYQGPEGQDAYEVRAAMWPDHAPTPGRA